MSPFPVMEPNVTGQMTQTKFRGSKVGFIYACGPRGGSLQILGTGESQKPAYIGRGLITTIGEKMWGGAWREAGSRGLQKQKAEVNTAACGSAELS